MGVWRSSRDLAGSHHFPGGVDPRRTRRGHHIFGLAKEHLGLLVVDQLWCVGRACGARSRVSPARAVSPSCWLAIAVTARASGERFWSAVGARRPNAVDGFDRLRGLPRAVQRQGECLAILRKPFRVIGDDLAGGLEPPHGQAVIVGLTTGPQDGEAAAVVKSRGILGAMRLRSRVPLPESAGLKLFSARRASRTSVLSR